MSFGAVLGGARPAAALACAGGARACGVRDPGAVDPPDLTTTRADRPDLRPGGGAAAQPASTRRARAPPLADRRGGRRSDARRARTSPTVRTSLPRTWPPSMRSCASAARSSGKPPRRAGARPPSAHQRRDVLAEVVAARAHEDVVDLVPSRGSGGGGRPRRAGRRWRSAAKACSRPSPPNRSSAASAPASPEQLVHARGPRPSSA